jgi:hypothetical protein
MMASLTGTRAVAQKPHVSRGDSVVLAIPRGLSQITEVSGFSGGSPRFHFDIRITADSAVEVYDDIEKRWRRDWRTLGFPDVNKRVVEGVRRVTRDTKASTARHFVEYTLREPQKVDYRVFVAIPEEVAIRHVIARAADLDSIRNVAFDTLAAHIFTGRLEAIAPNDRRTLLEFANLTDASTRISSETFKDRVYLVFRAPSDGNTWNDLRVAKNERIGRLIEKQLALLKAASSRVTPEVALGIKLEQHTSHGTAPYYRDVQIDRVEAYFPLDALVKLANADITSQELVTQAIILVNGDRIALDMSKL